MQRQGLAVSCVPSAPPCAGVPPRRAPEWSRRRRRGPGKSSGKPAGVPKTGCRALSAGADRHNHIVRRRHPRREGEWSFRSGAGGARDAMGQAAFWCRRSTRWGVSVLPPPRLRWGEAARSRRNTAITTLNGAGSSRPALNPRRANERGHASRKSRRAALPHPNATRPGDAAKCRTNDRRNHSSSPPRMPATIWRGHRITSRRTARDPGRRPKGRAERKALVVLRGHAILRALRPDEFYFGIAKLQGLRRGLSY